MGIGASTNVAYQGTFLMDVEMSTAEVVERHSNGHDIHVCLTSVNDVARFVVAALALNPNSWPAEFRMRGERRTVREVLHWAEVVRGGGNSLLIVLRSFANRSRRTVLDDNH